MNDENDMTQEEKESYQAYLERLSNPPCPMKATSEQIEELRREGYNI